jgi:hypothetical protein
MWSIEGHTALVPVVFLGPAKEIRGRDGSHVLEILNTRRKVTLPLWNITDRPYLTEAVV